SHGFRWLPGHHRADQGHGDPGWREHLPAGDRGVLVHPPRHPGRPGHRRSRREVRRGAHGLGAAALGRARADRRRAARVLRGTARALQDPAVRAHRGGVPDDGDRQGAQGRDARALGGDPRPRRHITRHERGVRALRPGTSVANATDVRFWRMPRPTVGSPGMKVLIAGGAGYIGSTIAYACSDAGISPVILDSLVTGRRELAPGLSFYQGDIADGELIDRIFAEHPDIAAVIHCAALIVVPDSVADPVGYYRANVAGSLDFTAHLLRNGCPRLIFSSSAAIYRAGQDLSVDEDSAIDPQSPYARTKAVCEAMFADIAATQPIRVLSLRYFNPIGAD